MNITHTIVSFSIGFEHFNLRTSTQLAHARFLKLNGLEYVNTMPTLATIHENTERGPNKIGFLLIGEQGQLHHFSIDKNELIRTATKHNIRLVNERGPKHQLFVNKFFRRKLGQTTEVTNQTA